VLFPFLGGVAAGYSGPQRRGGTSRVIVKVSEMTGYDLRHCYRIQNTAFDVIVRYSMEKGVYTYNNQF